MRALVLAFVAAAGLTAVAATAQTPPGRQITVCLDSSGQRHQAVCQRGTEEGQAYVCTCGEGLTAVSAPACAVGQSPAPEGSASTQAMKTALTTGTLNNVQVGGHPMCIQARHAPG
jgi:hypothetical protein